MSLLLDESQQEVLSSKEQKINKVPYVYISLPNNTLQLAVSSLIKIGEPQERVRERSFLHTNPFHFGGANFDHETETTIVDRRKRFLLSLLIVDIICSLIILIGFFSFFPPSFCDFKIYGIQPKMHIMKRMIYVMMHSLHVVFC